SRQDIATATADYYGDHETSPYYLYSVALGAGSKIRTSILTRPDWVDIAIPLTTGYDRLTPAASDTPIPTQRLTDDMASRAAQRLVETQALGARLVDMPLYRLLSVDLSGNAISGTMSLAHFTDYALTADLLESELLDAIASGSLTDLPIRDNYLPDLASVLDLRG